MSIFSGLLSPNLRSIYTYYCRLIILTPYRLIIHKCTTVRLPIEIYTPNTSLIIHINLKSTTYCSTSQCLNLMSILILTPYPFLYQLRTLNP